MLQDRADESAFPSGYGDGDAVQSHSEKHCRARQHEMLSRTSGMDVRGSLSFLLFTDVIFRGSQDQLCNPSLGYLSTLGCRASSTSHSLSEEESWAGDRSGWSPGFMSVFGARPRWAMHLPHLQVTFSVYTGVLVA
jgi:hypothetical protein